VASEPSGKRAARRTSRGAHNAQGNRHKHLAPQAPNTTPLKSRNSPSPCRSAQTKSPLCKVHRLTTCLLIDTRGPALSAKQCTYGPLLRAAVLSGHPPTGSHSRLRLAATDKGRRPVNTGSDDLATGCPSIVHCPRAAGEGELSSGAHRSATPRRRPQGPQSDQSGAARASRKGPIEAEQTSSEGAGGRCYAEAVARVQVGRAGDVRKGVISELNCGGRPIGQRRLSALSGGPSSAQAAQEHGHTNGAH